MKRDTALDSWRGLMLVIMAAYHFGGPLGETVRQVLGYVSAAEGFVLLSGIMCGLVYGRYGSAGFALMRQRTWQRAWAIYRYHVAVMLAILAFIVLLATVASGIAEYYRKTDLGELLEYPAESLLPVLLCLYVPPMFGILGLYVAYMIVAPFLLRQFMQGRAPLVFAASFTCWLFAQAGGGTALGDLLPGRAYMQLAPFDVFAWQVLFVAGAYIGWRRFVGRDVMQGFSPALFCSALAVATALFIARHWIADLAPSPSWNAVNLARLGWLRIVDTAAVALTIYGLAHSFGLVLRSRWLELLGRNSLPVFAFHGLVIYMAIPVRWYVLTRGPLVDGVVLVLFIASLTIPAVLHERIREVARRPAANLDTALPRRYM